MSFSEFDFDGKKSHQILGDIVHNPDFDLKINGRIFSGIGHQKLALNKHTIWKIPACIDC